MFKSDIEIAQEAKMSHIRDIAGRFGIAEDELEFYGKYKAKLTDELEKRVAGNKDGKLILVTAINPTPAGEATKYLRLHSAMRSCLPLSSWQQMPRCTRQEQLRSWS